MRLASKSVTVPITKECHSLSIGKYSGVADQNQEVETIDMDNSQSRGEYF